MHATQEEAAQFMLKPQYTSEHVHFLALRAWKEVLSAFVMTPFTELYLQGSQIGSLWLLIPGISEPKPCNQGTLQKQMCKSQTSPEMLV